MNTSTPLTCNTAFVRAKGTMQNMVPIRRAEYTGKLYIKLLKLSA